MSGGGAPVRDASAEDVAAAVADAAAAQRACRDWPSARWGAVLHAVAAALERRGEAVRAAAAAETGLDEARLAGELARTLNQLRSFAALAEEGSHVEAILDGADPAATPPRPDLRRMLIGIGPVAIFEASNFPLAFGVAGTDTAAAFAAGCAVVVKAHEAHPETARLCGEAIEEALAACEAPAGLFALLHGRGREVGRRLVEAPEIAAVAFTGSLAGGRALHDLAAARPRPIPVFAEMGSLNPLLVTAAALAERGEELVTQLAASIGGSSGQLCTKPGVVLVPAGDAGDRFAAALAARLAALEPGRMLTAQMCERLAGQVAATAALPGVEVLAGSAEPSAEGARFAPTLLACSAERFLAEEALREEHFGPVALVVRHRDDDERARVLAAIEGTLTVTIHAGAEEPPHLGELHALAVERAGRVLWGGVPTGVAVVTAMQHGGPYPATTNASHTSVGLTAHRRFQRPVVFQDAPQAVLPPALRDGNPLRIRRIVDGRGTDGEES